MKNLIESNIMAKSFRCIQSMHNISKSPELTLQSETDSKISSKMNINININTKTKTKPYQKTPIHTQQAPMLKTTKYHNKSALKQKYHSQQVSSLYSEHIYKSMQRDYLIQAQLQKSKAMLEAQKKEKMQLLFQQKQLKIQMAKLIQQNKVILFALDSMTVKLDMQSKSNDKNKELRRQTAVLLKTQFGHHDLKNSGTVRFQATPEEDSFSEISDEEMEESERMARKERKERKDRNGRNSKDNQIDVEQKQFSKILEKIKRNKSLQKEFDINQSDSIRAILEEQQKNQAKILEMQGSYNQAQQKIKGLQNQISTLKEQNHQFSTQIPQLTKLLMLKDQELDKIRMQLRTEKQKNFNLQKQILELKQNEVKLTAQKQKLDEKAKLLQNQLKFTQQEYQQREEKQKKCVSTLQKFTKDLKLSDEKIQNFLKQQISDYNDQQSTDLNKPKKVYNEQLSYILHLCKKKQTVYESMIQELKQKMREDDFRTMILQKKLNNFTNHQDQLRYLISNQPDKDTIFRKILRFGH